jgi:hypothetical protein
MFQDYCIREVNELCNIHCTIYIYQQNVIESKRLQDIYERIHLIRNNI